MHTALAPDALDYPAEGRRGKRLCCEEKRDCYAERRCTETELGPNLYRKPTG